MADWSQARAGPNSGKLSLEITETGPNICAFLFYVPLPFENSVGSLSSLSGRSFKSRVPISALKAFAKKSGQFVRGRGGTPGFEQADAQ